MLLVQRKKDSLSEKGSLRTFVTLKNKFWEFHDDGRKMSRAKEFENVIHPSIIKPIDQSLPVLMVVPPPELHLMTGPFNTIFEDMMKIWPAAESWLDKCNTRRHAQHGGGFTGNSCMQLLEKLDILASICPMNCLPHVKALRCFHDVSLQFFLALI